MFDLGNLRNQPAMRFLSILHLIALETFKEPWVPRLVFSDPVGGGVGVGDGEWGFEGRIGLGTPVVSLRYWLLQGNVYEEIMQTCGVWFSCVACISVRNFDLKFFFSDI